MTCVLIKYPCSVCGVEKEPKEMVFDSDCGKPTVCHDCFGKGNKRLKVLILGVDGYIGWALAMHLALKDHRVYGVDNLSRRRRVEEVGSWSATQIKSPNERVNSFAKETNKNICFSFGDVQDSNFCFHLFRHVKPDVVVHLAEIPSAPYSMIDLNHCNETMTNNILGTNNILYAMHKLAPNCHLLKLGTMGEYGTPNIDIAEGVFEVEYHGRKDKLPFPRQGGSFYHLSKIHDTHNIMFACKIWGLRSTDVMQGVVHGIRTKEMTSDALLTRFDFDEVWGTAINRFCAQTIIGHTLTPYGSGKQIRGYIPLRDSLQGLTLALENPPCESEYRTLNQFDECYMINELAEHVVNVARELGMDAKAVHVENPRVEAEEHYYNPERETLGKLGFKASHSLDDELRITLKELLRWTERIEAKKDHILPTVKWRA